MKKLFSTLLVVTFATVVMAQSGLSCDDPIPVDENYSATIPGPCERWYVANTYDLPLHVYFRPFVDNSSEGPAVSIDFTCVPGKYDDPNVDSLINTITDFGLEFPVEFQCDLVERGGKNEWDMAIDKTYREQMTKFGITYNLQAIVRVVYHEGGEISLKPDTVFKNCIENSDKILLDDTLDILPNDVDRVFVVSYADWQNDSTRFVWEGEGSARIWLSYTKCEFEPSLLEPFVWNYFDVSQDAPHKLYTEQMKEDIKAYPGGGIFYGKVIASSAGKLVVEKMPMGAIQGGATLLQYGESIDLSANDERVFCFPRTWTSTQFIASTQEGVSFFISNTPEFTPSVDDANVLNTYEFSNVSGIRLLELSTKDMTNLVALAKDDYMYVRFICDKALTIKPQVWTPSAGADKSLILPKNKQFNVPKGSKSTLYRLRYDDWKAADIEAEWTGRRVLPTYFASVPEFQLSSTASGVLSYFSFSKGTNVVDAATVDTWAENVGEDGFVYVIFDNNSTAGNLTLKYVAPEPEEPELPVDSALLNTVELKVGDNLNVALDSVFTIYRINYAEWLATGATLTWTGSEPLHVFVAETYQFAVAPYNKYVHAYVPVPAGGGVVFDKNMLEALKDKVGENGYLYVRLLTEFPGNLSVK